jgi:hypothetical protein
MSRTDVDLLRRVRFLLVATALAAISLPAAAQADDTPTELVISGDRSLELTTSDLNACYTENNENGTPVFNAQLTDLTVNEVIQISVLGTVGDHPAKASDGHAQITLLGLDTSPQGNPFVEWDGSSGTVTLDNIDTQVALDDGSADTHGALGHVEANLTGSQGTLHISGPFACHLAG